MNYKGVIIEESLDDVNILKDIKVLKTKVEDVTKKHQTFWLKKWTLHTVEITEDKAEKIATKLSNGLEKEHNWYADYKNDKYHYIIYRNKIFKVDLQNPILYADAKKYGLSLGIPKHQVDFDPDDKMWKRD
ncbi:MAG: hypothetical protein ABIE68_02155 [bacterium]